MILSKSFVSMMSTTNFFFLRLDRFIQFLNTSSVVIGLEFVFSNLCLTVSENMLSLSFQKNPNLFTFRAVSLSFWDTSNLWVKCGANNGSPFSLMTDRRRQTGRQAFLLQSDRLVFGKHPRVPCRWWRHRSRSHSGAAVPQRIPVCSRHKPLWCGTRWAPYLWEARSRPGCQGPQRSCTEDLSTTSWKMKLTGRRKNSLIKKKKMRKKKWVEVSKQSEIHTTMRVRHEMGWVSTDPNLSHAGACDSLWKLDGVRCGVHTHRRLQQTTVSCKRSNCNKIRTNRESRHVWGFVKRRHKQRVSPFYHVVLHLSSVVDFLVNCHELHQESLHCHQLLEEELDDECHCWYFQNGTGLSCLSPDSWCRRLHVVNASLKSERSLTGPLFFRFIEKDPRILSVSKVLFLRHSIGGASLSIWIQTSSVRSCSSWDSRNMGSCMKRSWIPSKFLLMNLFLK